MTTYAITRKHQPDLILPEKARPDSYACRRVFNSDQLIERFDKWLLICGRSANTRVTYRFAAKQFAQFLPDKPISTATKEDVRGFLSTLYLRELAASSIQSRLDALRVFFDFLQLGDLVRDSVPRHILRRKLPLRLPGAKSEEEIERLINAAKTLRDRAILELLYASGLRVNECAQLRVEDVNLRARSLIVRHGKGDKDRIGLFGRKAAEALSEYLGDRRTGPLFVREPQKQRGGLTRDRYGSWWGQWREADDNGKIVMRSVRLGDFDLPTKERARQALNAFLSDKLPTSRKEFRDGLVTRSIYRIVVLAAKRTGITGVHPHTLRHSMATHMLNRGMDVRFVQELLGHSAPNATQKYLHVAIEHLQEVHRRCLERG